MILENKHYSKIIDKNKIAMLKECENGVIEILIVREHIKPGVMHLITIDMNENKYRYENSKKDVFESTDFSELIGLTGSKKVKYFDKEMNVLKSKEFYQELINEVNKDIEVMNNMDDFITAVFMK